MKAFLLGYVTRFDALSSRERLLVFAAALAIVGFALQALLIEPALRSSARMREQLAQQEKTLDAVQAANRALIAARADPDGATRARIVQSRKDLEALTARLGTMAQGLVPPERMPSLLQSLLGTDSRLVVVALRSLVPSPLTQASQPQGAEKPAGAVGVFKHGIELTAQGSYEDLYRYVTGLEQGPFRMYWSDAVLDASAYPNVRLTLRVYTVSTDPSWLRL